MEKFAFLLKTYRRDFEEAKTLFKTFQKHNRDGITLYVMLPKDDEELFKSCMAGEDLQNIIVLKEEDELGKHLDFSDLSGRFESYMKNGYLNQQIIKLAFWECKLCENYMCIDSDGYFIRDFYLKDFMYDTDVPYTVLIEDNDLKADPYYYYRFWTHSREQMIPNIQREFNMEDERLMTCHGFQIFSCKVLEDFYERYMKINELSYSKVLEKCALEFSWYNLWLQKEKVIPIHPCEPLFKTFHTERQYIMTWLSGVEEVDLARSYIGIVMNSKSGVKAYGNMKGESCDLPINRIPVLIKLILRSGLSYLRKNKRK